jgi:nitroimidazol reductase NimA-like FMN-containing flavoprotein (pyridoxamine 5'-phosphate oxidase superfamily)
MRSSTHPTTNELSRAECLHLLESAGWGRLGVIVGDRPQIFPVNHVIDDQAILIRTGAGTKLGAAADQPVAFQADGLAPIRGAAWSVQVSGHAVEVTDVREIVGLMPDLAEPWEAGAKPHLLRIEIEEITGISFPVREAT